MASARARLRVVLLVALSLALAGWGLLLQPPPARAEEATKVLLLLDVSGSMNERIAGGGTKFAAAKRALKRVSAALPAGTQVGLRVYGSEIAEPKAQNPKACTDTKLVQPIGPLDQRRMNRAVDSFTAKGETPIAYSLGKAVDDLGGSGKRVLVLISDGEESCSGDPCPAARKLAGSGVDLQFNAIGLSVGSKARRQLQCIADAGDGSYYDASESDELSEALRKITERALRPFQITGTPVKGTLDEADAPVLTAGQYRDRYNTSDTKRYYRIERTPGSLVTASVTSLVRPWKDATSDSWSIRLTTETGQRCGSGLAGGTSFDSVTVASAAARSAKPSGATTPPGSPSSTAKPDPCSAGPLLLSLSRSSITKDRRTAPVEIVVSEEPAVINLAALPEPVLEYSGTSKRVPTGGKVRAATGGSSFSNAAELTAGSWSDRVSIGETVFYRVRIEPGQRLRTSVQVPAPKASLPLDFAEAVVPRLTLFSPSRTELTSDSVVLNGSLRATLTRATPEVRVRNREVRPTGLYDRISYAAAAGDYYVALDMRPVSAPLVGRAVPVRLRIAVDGTPQGLPEYGTIASASPTPTVSGSATPSSAPSATGGPVTTEPADGGLSPLAARVGAAVAVVALGAATALLLRRRSARTRRSSR